MSKVKTKKKTKNNKISKKLIASIVAGVIVVLVIFFIVLGVGIYKLNWQSSFVTKTASLFPFPAIKVDNQWILYGDYQKNVNSLINFYNKQVEMGGVDVPGEEIIRFDVRERMIKNVLAEKIAKKYKIKTTKEEVNQEFQKIIDMQGSLESVKNFLNIWYQLSVDEYKEYFVQPLVLQRKISEVLINTDGQNKISQENIFKAYNSLKNGESSFEELVKQYSQDRFAEINGVVGYVPNDFYPQDITQMLFSMEAGEYTEPISLSDSYQIIKVLDIDENEGLIKIARIYLSLEGFELVLNELLNQVKIVEYVK